MTGEKSRPEEDIEAQLERAAANRKREKYILVLYISGATPRSTRAIENIRQLCEEYLKDRYVLEVVDIYQNPEKARDEQVVAAPTLIKKLPLPLRRFIGDLSNSERILIGLEIEEEEPGSQDTEA